METSVESKLRKTAASPMLSSGEQTPARTALWQQIALTAYLKAENRGFNPGHELDDWLEAEREVAAETVDEELAA